MSSDPDRRPPVNHRRTITAARHPRRAATHQTPPHSSARLRHLITTPRSPYQRPPITLTLGCFDRGAVGIYLSFIYLFS
ncbi:hypothetical protein E2C01_084134 [Portunus trituberculatus]|uniref:Uncharacterized protein n=1 Tax=Portunus trituberculatus TaxID=210409 RepID=A0A5B7J8E4_PORTR|nr:hypothetical protein [Portunus trituberculatus]